MDNNIVEKIKKLLRLSESSNQHEAESALSFAKELATRHEIDLYSIDAWKDQQETETFERVDIDAGQRLCVASDYVGSIIIQHFGTRVIYFGNRVSGRKIAFIGKKNEVEIAQFVYSFLSETMMRLWRQYQIRNQIDTSHRTSWFMGFYNGLSAKLTAAKEKAESESFASLDQDKVAEVKNKYALVRVSNEEKLATVVKTHFNNLKNINKQRSVTDYKTYIHGQETGKTVNINRAIGQTQNQGVIS